MPNREGWRGERERERAICHQTKCKAANYPSDNKVIPKEILKKINIKMIPNKVQSNKSSILTLVEN